MVLNNRGPMVLKIDTEHVGTVRKLAMPLYFGEFIVVLWLAFVGAKPRTADA